MIRKINALFGLLSTLLLLDHGIFFSVWMLSRGSIEKSGPLFSWILTIFMGIHVVLSVIVMITNTKNAKENKHKEYVKLNAEIYLQRISGVLIIPLTVAHILGASAYFQPMILHAILQPLFFGAILTHVAVSVGRSLITLGVGNSKAVKVVNIITKILCAMIFVAGVIGFYLCLFKGVVQ